MSVGTARETQSYAFMPWKMTGKWRGDMDGDAVGADHDVLTLKASRSINSFKDMMQHHISQSNGNVIIDGLHGDKIILKNVVNDDLGRSDFLF